MNNIIKFYKKSVYGISHMYVATKKERLAIFALTHKKTLDPVAKGGLEMLGFVFEEVLESQAEPD